ncbi:BQ2448_924 [Microbotryum intermedium]|uniref:BQ2448_924 protein n=1 Tax=Microbotryum intermedium TaxID=269621 RepID=A0A238F9V8_9BASI|nr:BQ2448_924 [Microbotryum intermedium]
MPGPGRSAPASPRQSSRIPTRRSSASTPPSTAGPTTPAAIAANSTSIGSPSRPAASTASQATPTSSATNETGRRPERSRPISYPHRLSHEATAGVNMDLDGNRTIDVISNPAESSQRSPPDTRERPVTNRSVQKHISASLSKMHGVGEDLRPPSSLVYPAPIRFPSHPNRPSSSSSTTVGQPRRSTCPVRPKLERPSSTCYTSLPVPPPRTPGDDEDEASHSLQWSSWRWGWGSRDGQQQQAADCLAERGTMGSRTKQSNEREPLLEYSTAAGEMRSREGLPKVTRQCLIAEIKCYGKYMLPPIIVFLGLAMSLALVLYAHARSRQSDTGAHP